MQTERSVLPRDPTKALERIIIASQANFDHLSGEARANAKTFNVAMAELEGLINELRAFIGDLDGRVAALEP